MSQPARHLRLIEARLDLARAAAKRRRPETLHELDVAERAYELAAPPYAPHGDPEFAPLPETPRKAT
jgi:hypothetical protein